MSETWASRVSTALFELEQAQEIKKLEEFKLTGYPDSTVKLANGLKAVATHMKSRAYRKVNRDVFVVNQNSFDMHKANNLEVRLADANGALSDFIKFLKDEELWEDTVIVQSSDFGRTMTTNSNGGTGKLSIIGSCIFISNVSQLPCLFLKTMGGVGTTS